VGQQTPLWALSALGAMGSDYVQLHMSSLCPPNFMSRGASRMLILYTYLGVACDFGQMFLELDK